MVFTNVIFSNRSTNHVVIIWYHWIPLSLVSRYIKIIAQKSSKPQSLGPDNRGGHESGKLQDKISLINTQSLYCVMQGAVPPVTPQGRAAAPKFLPRKIKNPPRNHSRRVYDHQAGVPLSSLASALSCREYVEDFLFSPMGGL